VLLRLQVYLMLRFFNWRRVESIREFALRLWRFLWSGVALPVLLAGHFGSTADETLGAVVGAMAFNGWGLGSFAYHG